MTEQEYLTKLVACDTSSGGKEEPGNRTVVELMRRHFLACGLVTLTYEVDNEVTQNLLALSPAVLTRVKDARLAAASDAAGMATARATGATNLPGPQLGLLLSGHSDCVPFAAAAWQSDPLTLTEREGKLYGRGTCDMKGYLACMMVVAEKLWAKASKTNQALPALSYLVTCNEETSMSGAVSARPLLEVPLTSAYFTNLKIEAGDSAEAQALKNALLQEPTLFSSWLKAEPQANLAHNAAAAVASAPAPAAPTTPLLEAKPARFDLILIGEATLMQVVCGHKGWMARDLHLYGKSGHSSDPERGFNALALTEVALGAFSEWQSKLKQYSVDAHFAIPFATSNLGLISGGHGYNSICDDIKIGFDIRPTPTISLAKIELCLGEMLHTINSTLPQRKSFTIDQAELTTPFPDTPAFANDDAASLQLLKEVLPEDTTYSYVNYCTEASFLQDLGPCVVMGPGSIEQAHTVDEFVEAAQLPLCTTTLLNISALATCKYAQAHTQA